MQGLRYLAPNLVTSGAIVLGLMAIIRGFEGHYVEAGWYILWCGALDRIDGLVARLVRGSSEFGVQMDSFADFLNFGVAPALLVYSALSNTEGLPFSKGLGHTLLLISALMWVLGATARLARFNVVKDDEADSRIFFGIPTTLAAALLITWFLALQKYAAPGTPLHAPELFSIDPLIPLSHGAAAWTAMPIALVAGGLLMVSNVRMYKLALLKSKAANVLLLSCSAVATVFLALRIIPEYHAILASIWLLMWALRGVFDPALRAMKPPPLFPTPDSSGS